MKHTRFAKVLVAMFAGVLMVAALGGCAQQDTAAAQQQSENRQYMTQVNQTMDDLKSRLESFTDAVSRGDVVGMRTQADNAFKAIDDLSNLNVPDALKDIQKEYVDGTADLKDALNSGNRQRHRGTALRLFHVRSAHPGYQVEVRRGHRQAPVGRQQGQRAAGITSTDTHTALSGGPFGLPLSHSTTLASAQSYCRVFGCRLSVSLMLILRLLRGRLVAEGIMERENTIHFPT